MRARNDAARLTDDETLIVEWNGETLGRFRARRASSWTRYRLRVTGSGRIDRLAFREVNSDGNSDGTGPLLDDVSLIEI